MNSAIINKRITVREAGQKNEQTDLLLSYPDEITFAVEQDADNERAISMYRKAGFVEYGRNPKGFNSCVSGYNEILYMRLEL